MKIRFFAPLLAALLLAATALSAAAFSDLPAEHWAHRDITELTGQGIVNGYPDGRFVPDAAVSVGEFTKLMCMAIDPAYVAQGPDRPYAEAASLADHWAVEYALRLGRLCGFDRVPTAGTDAMNRVIPRIEMAQLAAAVHSTRLGRPVPVADAAVLARFSDIGGLGDPLRAALSYCVQEGLISGFEDGTFRPGDGLTRAQAAKMTVSVSGGFGALPQGETGKALRALRALLPAAVENGGLSDGAYRFCLESLAAYLEWYPQPLVDALAATGCRLLFAEAPGHSFENGLLTLSLDPALLGDATGRRQAAEALRAGFNYVAGNVVPARLAAASGIRLTRDTGVDKLAEVAELCLLAWDGAAKPVGTALAASAAEQGDSGRELLLDMEAAYLLLSRLYRLSEADLAKINVFESGYRFTVAVQ